MTGWRRSWRARSPCYASPPPSCSAWSWQYRLSEASRALARSVQLRYAGATSRMQAALGAAEELRGSSASAAEEKDHELSERAAATRHALTLLEEAGEASAR